MSRTPDRLRLAGAAGVAGGVGWAALAVLTLLTDLRPTLLWYGALDRLTPIALALLTAGVAGYRARTEAEWGRLATAGFVAFLSGLVGALAGSVAYVGADLLAGWTVSVWAYFLALVGATAFGIGLLLDGVPPRSGAVLLALVLPGGLGASLALAVGGAIPDEAVVPVGPAVFLGAGVAALGWWLYRREGETTG